MDVVIKSGVLLEEEEGHGPDDDCRVKAIGSTLRYFPTNLLSPATQNTSGGAGLDPDS